MIKGKRINIRAINTTDLDTILIWVNDPEIKSGIGTMFPISNFEHKNWYERLSSNTNSRNFIIEDETTKDIMGIVGYKNANYFNRNLELFLYIGEKKYWNMGYGEEALKLIIKFAFEELNMQKVYVRVFNYNKNAIKLYEKIGFKIEGCLKKDVFKKGKYHDLLIMAFFIEDLINKNI